MVASHDPADPSGDAAPVVEARARLDDSISGYNRQARLAAQYRGAVERFERARESFETLRAGVSTTHEATLAVKHAVELERLRSARESTAFHRTGVQLAVREYVHSLRDQGITPERVLVAVKGRLLHAVTAHAPDAPRLESVQLAEDVSRWAIAALFDAA
jgi:hypothetical protein